MKTINDIIDMYVNYAMEIIRGLKAECDNRECHDCPLCYDNACLFCGVPTDYDTDKIERGIKILLEKEIEEYENNK